MNPPEILYVGGEDVRMRLPLLRRLQAAGFSVSVCGTDDPRVFEEAGVAYYPYRLSRSVDPIEDSRSIGDLSRVFHSHTPDLVHSFDTKPNFLTPIAAHRMKVRATVRTITGMGRVFSPGSVGTRFLRPVYKQLFRYTDKLTDTTVFQNENDMNFFKTNGMVKSGKEKLVRGSGIDVNELMAQVPSPDIAENLKAQLGLSGKFVVTMVSRIIHQKGVLEFLKAAEIVCQRLPGVRFLLVGPRESEGAQAVPEKEIQKYSEYADYLGRRSDIAALLSLSDVFVLPTMFGEGVPRSLLEAAALGLPLITTDVGGCNDVVTHSWNGLLVPGKSARQVAEAVEQLFAQADLRRQMGERSAALVRQEFSLDKVARDYIDIYREQLCRERL